MIPFLNILLKQWYFRYKGVIEECFCNFQTNITPVNSVITWKHLLSIAAVYEIRVADGGEDDIDTAVDELGDWVAWNKNGSKLH